MQWCDMLSDPVQLPPNEQSCLNQVSVQKRRVQGQVEQFRSRMEAIEFMQLLWPNILWDVCTWGEAEDTSYNVCLCSAITAEPLMPIDVKMAFMYAESCRKRCIPKAVYIKALCTDWRGACMAWYSAQRIGIWCLWNVLLETVDSRRYSKSHACQSNVQVIYLCL